MCVLSRVCVNLNLSHPTCSGLYSLRILGSLRMCLQLVEELAASVNCLPVPCVLTTRCHHTLSAFCEHCQWECHTPDLQTRFCSCNARVRFSAIFVHELGVIVKELKNVDFSTEQINFLKTGRFDLVEIEIVLFYYRSNCSFGGKTQKCCMDLAVLWSQMLTCVTWDHENPLFVEVAVSRRI